MATKSVVIRFFAPVIDATVNALINASLSLLPAVLLSTV
jgi:hypothetical protein